MISEIFDMIWLHNWISFTDPCKSYVILKEGSIKALAERRKKLKSYSASQRMPTGHGGQY